VVDAADIFAGKAVQVERKLQVPEELELDAFSKGSCHCADRGKPLSGPDRLDRDVCKSFKDVLAEFSGEQGEFCARPSTAATVPNADVEPQVVGILTKAALIRFITAADWDTSETREPEVLNTTFPASPLSDCARGRKRSVPVDATTH